ncbi:MAG: hypothetical protein H0W86_09255 [Armatimonadetes bacterium]|nr:hypothetical protein [Armatimonadota bacterium]
MQRVNYRGGQAAFKLPKSWVAEYEETGGAAFHEPGGGILRLNILTFESPHPVTRHDAVNLLASSGRNEGREILGLRNGNALVRYREEFIEDEGEELVLNFWEVASTAEPTYLRLAVFSYAMPKAMALGPHVLKAVQMLEEEILNCEFAPELVAGE